MSRFTTLLLSCALLLPGCGGGSDNVVAVIGGLLGAAGCTAEGIENYGDMFDAIEAELQKSQVPSVLDVNTPAVTASGTITELAGDISDGFDPGDIARFLITSASFGGGVTGSGDVTVDFVNAGSIVITGGFSLDDGSCSVTFSNIGIDFDPTDDEDYGTGSVDFVTNSGDDTLTGTVTLNGGPIANVTASLNGGAPTGFSIDLDTYQPSFN